MKRLRWTWLLGVVLWTAGAFAQPVDTPPGDSGSTPPAAAEASGRDRAVQELRQAIEELRRAQEQLTNQSQAVEAAQRAQADLARRIEALADELGGAEGGAPAEGGVSNAELQRLRRQVQELRTDLDDLRSSSEQADDSLLSELERRATLSGITSHYLRIPHDADPYFRAFAVVLFVNAQITPRLRFYGEVEFEDAAKVGEGDGIVELEQGFGELALWPALGLRLGVVLVPFGKYNRRHEDWRLSFSIRPICQQIIFPSTYADVGGELYGVLVHSDRFQLSYEAAVVQGLTSNIVTEQGGRGLRNAKPSFASDNNAGKSVAGRLGVALGEHLDLGLSGYWGQYSDSGAGDFDALGMLGADIELAFRRISFRIEGVHVALDEGFAMVDDDADPETPDLRADYPTSLTGMYAEVEVRFWPAAMSSTPFGAFEDPVFFLAARFDAARLSFPGSSLSGTALSGSIGYRPVERSAIRFELEKSFGHIPASGAAGIAADDGWIASVSFSLGF